MTSRTKTKMTATAATARIAVVQNDARRRPLVERGLLVKERNPENRRVVEVTLTEQGRRDFEAGREHALDGLRKRLAALPASERERLVAACREVADVLRGLKKTQT